MAQIGDTMPANIETLDKALRISKGFQEHLAEISDPIAKYQMGRILCERLFVWSKDLVATEFVKLTSECSYMFGADTPSIADEADFIEFELTQAQGVFERPSVLRRGRDVTIIWTLLMPEVLNAQDFDSTELPSIFEDFGYDGALPPKETLAAPLHFPVNSIMTASL